MNKWKWMTFRHRTAYFIALGKILFDRKLSSSPYTAAADEAFELAWEGWLLHDVGDLVRFEMLCFEEERPVNLFVPLSTAHDEAEQAAWRCLMNMVAYAAYFYSQVKGIAPVPQSIENVPVVDVQGDFDEYFDIAIEDGASIRARVLDFLASKSGDDLTKEAILGYVAEIERE